MAGYESGKLLDAVEAELPYDGPHSEATVVDASSAVSQLVRYMNNATQPGMARRTLPYASSVYRALSGVGGALSSLDQLFRQLSDAITQHAERPGLYDDRRNRPGEQTAQELVAVLCHARSALAVTADQVSDARELSSHLGNE